VSTLREAVATPARGDVSSGRALVGTLAVTQTITWGVLYYAYAIVLPPMRADLGMSAATATGAFSLAVLMSGAAAVPVGRWLDQHGARALMTGGAAAGTLLVLA
jgi:MFS family permease